MPQKATTLAGTALEAFVSWEEHVAAFNAGNPCAMLFDLCGGGYLTAWCAVIWKTTLMSLDQHLQEVSA